MRSENFNIYCMSYRRPNAIMTKHLFEYCTYVVREEETEAYRESGIDDMLVIPHGEVFSFMSTLYWIIEHAPEDVVFIADDDISKFVYRLNDTNYIETKKDVPDKETITAEVERIGQLIYDLNIGMAFDNIVLAPYAYTQEFCFKGMPGHIRWINRTALKATYSRNDVAASDIDMVMQELLLNRIVLQPRYLCVKAFMDVNAGAERERKAHLELVENLKFKWGKYYDYNYRKNIGRIRVDR